MASRNGFVTVKLRDDAYARLKALVDTLMQRGWNAAGVKRSDPISHASVMEVALVTLEQKIKVRR